MNVLQKTNDLLLLSPSPKSSFPKSTDCILEIQPLELARQLTIIEREHHHKISIQEYLDVNRSTNISNYCNWQTSFINWITLEIITKFKLKQRVKIIKYMIELMKHLLELKNFNSALNIGKVLTSTPVSHLKRSLHRAERKDIAIQKIIESATMNIQQYESTEPFIPPITTVLDRLKEILSTPISQNGKLNWQQAQTLSSILLIIHNMNQHEYSLLTVDTIQHYIKQQMEFKVPQKDFDKLINLSINADSSGTSPASDEISPSLSKVLSKYSYKS